MLPVRVQTNPAPRHWVTFAKYGVGRFNRCLLSVSSPIAQMASDRREMNDKLGKLSPDLQVSTHYVSVTCSPRSRFLTVTVSSFSV